MILQVMAKMRIGIWVGISMVVVGGLGLLAIKISEMGGIEG